MWLAIRLPQLSLEALLINESAQEKPQGVINQNRMICLNSYALDSGVNLDQSTSSAYAMCERIELFERNIRLEIQLKTAIAILLYQYSSSIVISENELLWMEIGRSLKLYAGLNNLLAVIRNDLDQESITYRLAIGPTSVSAEILSFLDFDYSLDCFNQERLSFDLTRFEKQLSVLPVALMNVPLKSIQKIQSVGIKTIGELVELSNGALRKRFGSILSDYLLKLQGKLSDPKIVFIPPESFYQKLEFNEVIHYRQGLLFPIKRLLKELCRFLIIKQKTSQTIVWKLFDSEKNNIEFSVLVSENQISETIFLELTQLTLEHHSLQAPIEAISLSASKLCELTTQTDDLFGGVELFKQDSNFLHRINAKLGENSCYTLQQLPEPVPELAQKHYYSPHIVKKKERHNKSDRRMDEQSARPCWLFEIPQPMSVSGDRYFWRGELTLISSCERITHHWWQEKIARDYFFAEHENGNIYWVYEDKLTHQWFVQGLYS